ncbi:EAL domain-containing protein [Rhodoferax sp.]|uniref:bifunctional diguanylate cyclase/phosphodiesterase n=1 Tax=Rhodoferax sp. TaxID=50421 RepID=UPI0017A16C39|nr:EAL domain-containing protein [Rhodoferax sp.]MBA3058393.1 EAL domain-containing protein [Rhodoferax sp.]
MTGPEGKRGDTPKVSPRQSLKTKVTLITLLVFVLSLWSLSYYASRMLRQDMQRLLGVQQFATASLVAAQVDQALQTRVSALETVARAIRPALEEGPPALEVFLSQRVILQTLFNAGVYVLGPGGVLIGTVAMADRVGADYFQSPAVQAAFAEGKTSVGPPTHERLLKQPVFPVVAMIHDAGGQVVGALIGVTRLDQPSFLDIISQSRYGKTGGYFLVAPQSRLVIMASGQRQVMQALPVPGLNPAIDRFILGQQGHALIDIPNPLGVEVVASSKAIQVAPWHVAAVLPTAEAFAPIRAMQERMWLATGALTLLAGVLVWWLLARQLAPLQATARRLAAMADEQAPLQALPATRLDEIGQVVKGFNRLLGTLGQREALLQQILDTSSVAIFLVDRQGYITRANQRMVALFGYPLNQLQAMEYVALVHPTQREAGRQKMQALLASQIQSVDLERLYWRADQTEFWGHLTGQRFVDANGVEQGLVGVIADVTERRQLDAELRIAAIAFESQQGMSITDAQGVILRVNQAFSAITGYSALEAVGQSPRLLSSGRHDAAFYAAMWGSIARSGAWQGEIWNRRKNGEVFPEWLSISAVKDPGGQVTHYVATFSDISAHKAAQDQIKSLAFFDTLTGLPNRRLLLDRLVQAMVNGARHGRQGALLYIDLDDFKTLNNSYGHDVGDAVLQQVAQRLSACMREGDTVARPGADSFAVLLEALSSNAVEAATQAESVGEKIRLALSQPYDLDGRLHRSTASIGVTLLDDRQQEGVDEPLKRAELAMYQAKTAGRNTLRFFDPQMQTAVLALAALEADLREALRSDQFLLYYQAQVNGQGGVSGGEALVRWQHPLRGLVPPSEFIALAEQTSLILPLGQWVLETACAQLAAWASRPERAQLTVAVNVSALQFHQGDFVAQVMAALERSGANPQRLKLELTESLLVHDVEGIIAKMSALQAQGVGFSLDDFGTGYSSLSYLKRLPLNQLKIDQGFVRDILHDANDAAIAKMVVALADTLGLAVIAEGVETAAQRDFLAAQGCHAYQGYLFSRPLPIAQFEAFMQQEPIA